MKKLTGLTVAFLAGVACAEKTFNEPIYTVGVDGSVSNVLSAVNIVKTAGGVQAPSSYGELQAETAAGTLVKKGAGWLVVNEALANWSGQIHVDEGVLQVTCRGGLGKEKVPASSTSTTYATDEDATFVASGATLFMDSSLLDKKVRNESKKIVFEGEGAEGLGGAVVTYARNLSATASGNQSWWFGQIPTLSGDATVMMDTEITRTMFFADQNYRPMPILDLAGHTLRLVHAPDNNVTFNHNGTAVSNGTLIADNISYHLQNTGSSFAGGPACTLVFTNAAKFAWESVNGYAAGRRDWTVELADCGEWSVTGTGGGHSSVGTNDYAWYGPVKINQDKLKIRKVGANLYGLTLGGPVSGRGGIVPYNNMATNLWLHLLNPANSFQGGVQLADGGVVEAFANGALPANGGPLRLSNGTFYAVNGDVEDYEDVRTYNATAKTNGLCRRYVADYELPSAVFSGTGLVRVVESPKDVDTRIVTVGKSGRWSGSVVKQASGELLYDAAFGAPLLDIQGGGVKLGFASAGLYETHVDYNATKAGSGVFYNSNVTLSNVVTHSARMAYTRGAPDWVGYTAVNYEGYLWNRTGADASWSFAVAVNSEARVLIDGTEVCKGGNNGAKGTVTVGPGAHHFVLRMYTQSGVGGVAANYPPLFTDEITGAKKWPVNTCFFWDPQGRDKTDIERYYQRLSDPGDGSVVTLTVDGAAPDLEGFLPTFDRVKFGGAGTYLDLNGNDFAVDEVEGQGEVRNTNALWSDRTFTVREKLIVSGAQAAAGAALAVTGTLAFGEGAAIELSDVAELPRADVAVVTATAGIVGTPTLVTGLDRSRKYRLEAAADGKTLRLTYHSGTTLVFR